MNFFTVGFTLCALKFSMDMPVTYIIKLIGILFMLGGYKEIEPMYKSFAEYKKYTWLSAAAIFAGFVCSVLGTLKVTSGMTANVLSIIFGGLSVVLVLINQRAVIGHMKPKRELVNDPSLLHSLESAWKKMAFFTAVSLVGDILYRLLPFGNIQTVFGLIQVISLLLMYIYIVIMAVAFNKVREDFNVTHPV